MPGEALFLGIASIAAVVAGFTAVTSTLAPPGGTWSPVMRLRQRAIVSTSFNVMFESLALPIAFAGIGDERTSVAVASAGVAAYTTAIVIWRGRQLAQAGRDLAPTALILFALGPTAALLFWANALVFVAPAVYALALCVQLSVAVISFYSLVSAAEGR